MEEAETSLAVLLACTSDKSVPRYVFMAQLLETIHGFVPWSLRQQALDAPLVELRQGLKLLTGLAAEESPFEEMVGLARKATDRAALETLRAATEAPDKPVAAIEGGGDRRIYASQGTGRPAPPDAPC